jgi:septal ring factor EnvC (AmiA/AmiB activator)
MNQCNDPDHGAINAERTESRGLRKAWIQLDDKRQSLERELTAARKENEGLHYALKQSSTIYDVVTEQRDRLAEQIEANHKGTLMLEQMVYDAREQRDEARRLAERYRDLSCDTLEEADETLLPWEITNPNEL